MAALWQRTDLPRKSDSSPVALQLYYLYISSTQDLETSGGLPHPALLYTFPHNLGSNLKSQNGSIGCYVLQSFSVSWYSISAEAFQRETLDNKVLHWNLYTDLTQLDLEPVGSESSWLTTKSDSLSLSLLVNTYSSSSSDFIHPSLAKEGPQPSEWIVFIVICAL